MSYHVNNPSVVWKHTLIMDKVFGGKGEGLIKVKMPLGAKVVMFCSQSGQDYIWEVHEKHNEAHMYEQTFWFTSTGEEIPGWLLILNHVGSMKLNYLVFHLFEVSDQRGNMEGK